MRRMLTKNRSPNEVFGWFWKLSDLQLLQVSKERKLFSHCLCLEEIQVTLLHCFTLFILCSSYSCNKVSLRFHIPVILYIIFFGVGSLGLAIHCGLFSYIDYDDLHGHLTGC